MLDVLTCMMGSVPTGCWALAARAHLYDWISGWLRALQFRRGSKLKSHRTWPSLVTGRRGRYTDTRTEAIQLHRAITWFPKTLETHNVQFWTIAAVPASGSLSDSPCAEGLQLAPTKFADRDMATTTSRTVAQICWCCLPIPGLQRSGYCSPCPLSSRGMLGSGWSWHLFSSGLSLRTSWDPTWWRGVSPRLKSTILWELATI